MSKGKIGCKVEVEWLDSCHRSDWANIKEYQEWAKTVTRTSHWTNGYLIWEDDNVIAVAMNWVEYENDYTNVGEAMAIPKESVVSVRFS